MYEAMKYFYTYLDGCENMRIEMDCSMVVMLLVHKTTNDADPLVQFKLSLSDDEVDMLANLATQMVGGKYTYTIGAMKFKGNQFTC
ncbi:hypothetical protein LPJ66_006023 [Kickxella alabastrina]|uniref:Uncharacterized protein n=1 Tax=Kickxella alabastrina TaxID=61397 RepID=A0ACC1IF63_9FUNG|nr:hypothetical protein LPJ66_006023 [Kickxella alabastrina]